MSGICERDFKLMFKNFGILGAQWELLEPHHFGRTGALKFGTIGVHPNTKPLAEFLAHVQPAQKTKFPFVDFLSSYFFLFFSNCSFQILITIYILTLTPSYPADKAAFESLRLRWCTARCRTTAAPTSPTSRNGTRTETPPPGSCSTTTQTSWITTCTTT